MINNTILASTSAASNLETGVTDLCDLTTYSIQVNFSGSDVVGTLKLQGSLDNSIWVDISGSSQAITASADHIWDARAGYRYVKGVWTYTSGTGNISATIHIKQPIVQYA